MALMQKLSKTFAFPSIVVALAAVSLGFAIPAHARDNVYWSVGIGSPGVDVNVGNALPIYVQPQPVYVQPQPVYVQPQPVYVQPWPYYYRGSPPPVVYFRPGDHEHWRRGHGRRHHGDEDED